jgi:anti-sigma factor RsiW
MPECQSIEPLVTPYVDSELALEECDRVEDHLRACAPCRARIAAERSIRELLGERRPLLQDASAPALLRIRCAAASGHRESRPLWGGRGVRLALAATVVLVVAGAALNRATQASSRVMAAELTADHMKCFIFNRVLGFEQTPVDQLDVERTLASSFGWDADLPDRADEAGLVLVGARPCLYGEGRIAHVMYRYNGHPVSVFMLPGTRRPQELLDVWGHEAAIWSTDDRTFVLVAQAPPDEVKRIASFVHASLR